MVNLIAYSFLKTLNADNCDTFADCKPSFIGRQLQDGQVVYGDAYYEYIGLTDTKGNYFYLRYADKKESSFSRASQQLDSSTISYKIQHPLKLVVVFKEFNAEFFQYKLTNDIIGNKFSSFDRKRRPSMIITGSNSNVETIYKEETGKDLKNWRGDVKLLSFDLELSYFMEHDECLNLPDLCTNIDYCQFETLSNDCTNMDALIQRLKDLING